MAAEDNLQRVRRAFEELSRGNPTGLTQLLAEDVVYTTLGTTAFSSVFRGRADLVNRLFLPLSAELTTPVVFTIDQLFAADERVVMQARATSTLRSGAAYNNTYCFVFRFAGEQAVEVHEYFDTVLTTRAFAVPHERTQLLRCMDLNMWALFNEGNRVMRGVRLMETEHLSLALTPHGTAFHNMVMVKDGAVDVASLLDTARDFYAPRRAPFSIWTRAHADGALEAALHERGFVTLATMPGMALLSDPGTRSDVAGLAIRPTIDDDGRRAFLEITAAAYATYNAPRAYADDAFASLESVCAPHIQGFVGHVEGAPVAAAALYATHGVAGIGWVGTLPAQRGHGYAEAVTWAAIREGFRRGCAFANLQASPMGRPIYERMGFVTMTEYRILVAAA